MDNPPDFIHLFSRQVWQILNLDYPSVVWKRPLLISKLPTHQKWRKNRELKKSKSRLSLIVRVNVVLNRTVNWRDTTHFDSEDDYHTGYRNVSDCQRQQSYSGLRSQARSNSTYFWNDSWVQSFHSFIKSNRQSTTLRVHCTFFVHFFAVTAWLRFCWGPENKTTTFLFFFWTLM